MARPSERPPLWVRDVGIALPLLVFGLVGTRPAGDLQTATSRAPDHLAYLLVVVAALAFVAHRRALTWTLLGTTAAVAVYLAGGYPYGPVLLTVPALALVTASAWPRRRALVAVGASLGVLAAACVLRGAYADAGATWADILRAAGLWLSVAAAAFAIGSTARVRRESAAGVRAEQARRAASEEQLRMAQELHDVVGHGLAVIAMQAGVALHVLDRSPDPEQVRASLEAIRATSRESLDGLRVELAQLRATDEPPPRRPAPGLPDIDVLVARVRAGGVDVRLDVDPVDVPEPVGAAAYRIVQESLTNVLRHADASAADVRVSADRGALLVEVTDEGRGSEDDGTGTGIRGMRERAESLGGELHAGPRTAGGFGVRARLPLAPPEPALG